MDMSTPAHPMAPLLIMIEPRIATLTKEADNQKTSNHPCTNGCVNLTEFENHLEFISHENGTARTSQAGILGYIMGNNAPCL